MGRRSDAGRIVAGMAQLLLLINYTCNNRQDWMFPNLGLELQYAFCMSTIDSFVFCYIKNFKRNILEKKKYLKAINKLLYVEPECAITLYVREGHRRWRVILSQMANDFSSYWNAEQTLRISRPFIWAEWQSSTYVVPKAQCCLQVKNSTADLYSTCLCPVQTRESKTWAGHTLADQISPHCPSGGFTVSPH